MRIYNPKNQYRCTIIRGKAQNELDDLLPAYAKIVTDICPSKPDLFIKYFDKTISRYLSSPTKKTTANHRTEIAGKLFGLWFKDADGLIKASNRTKKLLETNDNPQFFKEIASKFQFPNGMDKTQTIKDRLKNEINIRPIAYILKVLMEGAKDKIYFTKNEIAYYILNNLDVLQGWVHYSSVIDVILKNRKAGILLKVEYSHKASSYSMQHISELLNIVELANLIRQKRIKTNVILMPNIKEDKLINEIASTWDKKPDFSLYGYNMDNVDEKEKMQLAWGKYYTDPDKNENLFVTNVDTLIQEEHTPIEFDTQVIGEEGEQYVFQKEKKRVSDFNPRLVNKVIFVGKQKGLGYDINSIIAERGSTAEHAIYIEVKSTKRVTKPQMNFNDQIDLTRNEWVAAEQHKKYYFIFRVYLTNEGIFIFKINDPVTLKENGIIYAEPIKYHVEFDHKAGTYYE